MLAYIPAPWILWDSDINNIYIYIYIYIYKSCQDCRVAPFSARRSTDIYRGHACWVDLFQPIQPILSHSRSNVWHILMILWCLSAERVLRLESIQVPERASRLLPSVHCKSPNPRGKCPMGHGRHNDFAGNWMVYLSSLIGLMSDVCIHGVAQKSWHTSRFRLKPICIIMQFNPLYSCWLKTVPRRPWRQCRGFMSSLASFCGARVPLIVLAPLVPAVAMACYRSTKPWASSKWQRQQQPWASPYYMMRCAGTQVRNAKWKNYWCCIGFAFPWRIHGAAIYGNM